MHTTRKDAPFPLAPGLAALLLLALAVAPAAHAQSYTLNTLVSFNGASGHDSLGSLILSGSTLYGTAFEGGANNDGTVFSLTPNAAPVPEASSLVSLGLLLLGGLGGVMLRVRRKSAAG